jgi:hypothetical protein
MRECFYQTCERRTYAAPQYGHEIYLKVGEDLGEKGRVAMSKEAMEELGIRKGDSVEIYGAWMQEAETSLSNEKDMTIIRMDKAIREALPCEIGQCVGVRSKYTEYKA